MEMARGTSMSPNLKQYNSSFLGNSDLDEDADVEDLKESLKNGLSDARKKITYLRDELKEKQKSLEQEKKMRNKAEESLSNLTNNGIKILSAPTSPIHFNMHNNSQSRSGTPNGYSVEKYMEELKSAKLLNTTLTEKLSQAEREINSLTQSNEESMLELEAKLSAKGAALIDKIYTAQKEREAAIINRLKLLTDEKQELIKRVKKMEKDQGFDSGVETGSLFGEEINPDNLSFNEVLNRLTSSNESRTIELHGEVMVDRLQNARSYNHERENEDIIKLKKERDAALKKASRLEQDLKEIQQERDIMEAQHRKNQKSRLKAMQKQLKVVVVERDEACERVRELEEELEQLKLQYNLKNALSRQNDLRDQFNDTLDEFEEKLNEKETELNRLKESNDDLSFQLNTAIQEKKKLSVKFDELKISSEKEKERATRSERLLAVLRRRYSRNYEETIS